MNEIVNYGVRTSFEVGRRLITGVIRIPYVGGAVTAGVGAVTGHLLYASACRNLGDEHQAEAARPAARAS